MQQYEKFVYRLQDDLQKVLEKRDRHFDVISEYRKLQHQLFLEKGSKTRMNVGCDFFMDAVLESDLVLMKLLDGIFLEMTKDEVNAFVEKRCLLEQRQADKLTDKAAEIKAHIKLVIQTIQDLMKLNPQ
ncbi:hypothetical protein EDD86DRAFT_255884 [Gorgonomyces haynaldii]|nr:hypothetical protein EDD86DRAFT_255884 [Gorgonomyces haynaldii]